MKVCAKCGHKQASGAFCGACGSDLKMDAGYTAEPRSSEYEATEQAAATSQSVGASQAERRSDSIQVKSRQYWSFFTHNIKNPTNAIHARESEITHGLITLALYTLAFALSIYFLANTTMRSLIGYTELPAFAIISRLTVVVLFLIAISYGSTFVMAKANKSVVTGKSLLAQFGSFSVPFMALNVLAMLTGLAGSIKATLFLGAISLTMLLYIVPVMLIFSQKPFRQHDQKVYASVGAIVVTSIANYILFTVIMDGLLTNLQMMMDF